MLFHVRGPCVPSHPVELKHWKVLCGNATLKKDIYVMEMSFDFFFLRVMPSLQKKLRMFFHLKSTVALGTCMNVLGVQLW